MFHKKITPKKIGGKGSNDEEYKTIAKFSVNGKSYMDAVTKIIFGKYKNILLGYSKIISERLYVSGKRVKDITDIEKAGHGTFDYTISKDGKKYVLFGNTYKDKGLWYINAQLIKYRR